MGKWKIMAPIVAALIIAFIGSIVTYTWVRKHTASTEPGQQLAETVGVATAQIDLPWGTKLGAEHVKSAPFLKETVPPGHFTDAKALEGRVLISPVNQGEPILESRLAPISVTTGGVSAVIKPGKRAIAVKGDKVIGLSGLINPGNRVDVLVTLTDPRTKEDMTKIVLEDVVVLAANTQVEKNEKGEVSPVDVYTLEVSPDEGERLALAATQGKVQFALRNITDAETVFTKGVSIPDALQAYRAPETVVVKAPNTKPAAPRITRTYREVEQIKGTEVSNVKF